MDRGAVILQALREKLERGWTESIRRSTGAHSVSFKPLTGGEFALVVAWKNGDKDHVFEKEFTRAYVLGASLHRPMPEWHLQKRACDHARDVMREVLAQRGVL
jgi:hypothetical protein